MIVGNQFNPWRVFVGAFIPNCIMSSTDMSSSAKLVYARLCQYAGKDGVAYPKQETLAEEVGLSSRGTQKILYELERMELIRVIRSEGRDRLAHKSNRYVFLWHEILAEGSSPDTNLGSPPDTNLGSSPQKVNHMKVNQKKHSLSEVANATIGRCVESSESSSPTTKSPTTKRELHPRWWKMAQRLYETTQTVRSQKRTPSQLREWADAFRLLHEKDKVDIPIIKDVFNWYCHQVPDRDKWVPEACSGPTFREKWDRIVKAMERTSTPVVGEPPDENPLEEEWLERGKKMVHEITMEGGTETSPEEAGRLIKRFCQWHSVVLDQFKARKLVGDKYYENPLRPTGLPLHGHYREWIVDQVSRWDKWAGGLREFLPGGKHFQRWLKEWQREKEWSPSREQQEIMNAAQTG